MLTELRVKFGLGLARDPAWTDGVKIDVVNFLAHDVICSGFDRKGNIQHAAMRALYDAVEKVPREPGELLFELYNNAAAWEKSQVEAINELGTIEQ